MRQQRVTSVRQGIEDCNVMDSLPKIGSEERLLRLAFYKSSEPKLARQPNDVTPAPNGAVSMTDCRFETNLYCPSRMLRHLNRQTARSEVFN